MSHDVFISYSSHDKTIADAICAALEGQRTRCWVAPRDIMPGRLWAEAILEAIDSSKVMTVVFSHHANGSPQVLREVERAVSKGVVIVPFRIEEVLPTKSMEYFLGSPHWLDAITPPLQRHIEKLVTAVNCLLSHGDLPVQAEPEHLWPASDRIAFQEIHPDDWSGIPKSRLFRFLRSLFEDKS
jgi:hypothetical protein